MRQTLTNPLAKIFGKNIIWSPEHMGGITRAGILNDPKALAHVTPMESGSLNKLKGVVSDKKLTGVIRNAAHRIDEPAFVRKQLVKANKLSKQAFNDYGVRQSTYSYDAKNKRINTKYPKLTLGDSLLAKTKAAIHNFIANGSMKKPVFKQLPEKLQESIKLIDKGKNANKILASHLDDIIPNWKGTKGFTLNNFAGAVSLEGLPSGVTQAIGKAASALGKGLRVLGVVSLPLDTIPFAQQMERGLGARSLDTGAMRWIEDLINAPKNIAQVFGGDLDYEERTFGKKYADKVAGEIGEEKITENIDQLFEGSEKIGDPMYDALGEYSFAARSDDREKLKKEALLPLGPEEEESETVTFDKWDAAEGGIVPRVAYKDGSNWLDRLSDDDVYNLSRGWRTDMKMDPDVMDRIKQKQILDAQEANEAGFKHRSQYEDTGSFIPEYVQDVVKKGFGTKEGLKYIGSKAGEGAVEGFEWFIYQLPHLVKELDKRGLMPGLDGQALNKMKKHLEKNKGKFNWMELMYTPNWGEEFLGFKMNDFQKEQIEKLKERFGKTEIPEGIASTGTAAELGTMFLADPFIIWGAASKLKNLKGKKDKLVDVDETIDISRRDFTKTVGTVGLTAFLAKPFRFFLKLKKILPRLKTWLR